MTDTKKISIKEFDKIMKDTYSPTTTIEWNGIEDAIKRDLSFKEMLKLVDDVTNSCFIGDKYMPELKDFAIKSGILEMYANFTLPTNLEHRYALIYSTDAVDTVMNYINTRQLGEIVAAVEDKIEKTSQANIESVHRQVNDICSSLLELKQNLESVFEGIGVDDVRDLIGAIANSQLDEEKLVRAHIEHTRTEEKPEDGE